MKEMTHLCTFCVDDLVCGFEVNCIQEVILAQRMTRVPVISPVVAGLINLRGQIVTAIDMRRRLGVAERGYSKFAMNLVVRTDNGLVSLIVDDVADILDLEPSRLEEPPSTLKGVLGELTRTVYKAPKGLVLVLDVERTVAFEEDEVQA